MLNNSEQSKDDKLLKHLSTYYINGIVRWIIEVQSEHFVYYAKAFDHVDILIVCRKLLNLGLHVNS